MNKFNVQIAERLLPHVRANWKVAEEVNRVLYSVRNYHIEKDDLESINDHLHEYLANPSYWYFIDLENEIRANLLNADQFDTAKYLHYLVKLYNTAQTFASAVVPILKQFRRDTDFERHFSNYEEWSDSENKEEFSSYEQFLGYAEFTLQGLTMFPGSLYTLILDEFELTNQQWRTLQTRKKTYYGELFVPQSITHVSKIVNSSPIVEIQVNKEIVQKDKDRLSTKQQILLLQRLGIFDLRNIQCLTEKKRGILFGNLLNRNEKNAEDTIRNRFDESQFSNGDRQVVSDLLDKIGVGIYQNL